MNSESFLDGNVTLLRGDCLELLPTLEENSIDSCVTDPPYHLTSIVKRFGSDTAAPAKIGKTGAYERSSRGFMGKQWDGGDIAFQPLVWELVFRALKPGAYLLAFGGTRTYHRLASAIEDAGFNVRDMLSWVFGSGFPKSHNIGNGLGTALKPAHEPVVLARKPLSEKSVAANVLKWGTGAINVDGCRIGNGEARQSMTGGMGRKASPVYGQFARDEVQDIITTQGRWPANLIHDGSEEVLAGFPDSGNGNGQATIAKRERNKGWCNSSPGEGVSAIDNFGDSGSAARFFAAFPLTEDDLKWQRGQECKTEHVSDVGECLSLQSEAAVSVLSNAVAMSGGGLTLKKSSYRAAFTSAMRNELRAISELVTRVILSIDKSALRGRRHERLTLSNSLASIAATLKPTGIITIIIDLSISNGFADAVTFDCIETSEEVGEAAFAKRFHYTSKADSDDRLGSKHPTVKPLDLIQYLVRLITPVGGNVLDPFAGTGTTAEAAFREGMASVLIEREPEYQADIIKRMGLCLAGPDTRRAATIKQESVSDLPMFARLQT